MSRLAGDPHPRPTRKPSSGFTSAAARLLLRHGGRDAANGESIEFFSALRNCLPDPHISGQTIRGMDDGRGKARRVGSGGSAVEVLSLSSGIGKHDYDWLLTPPGTPPWSPATSTSGHHQVSAAAVQSRLAKVGSWSHGRSNSRLGPTGVEKEGPTTSSRLSNCSSATSGNVVPSSRQLLRVRTSSASSINTVSNASVSTTPLSSAGMTPRTPGTARSPAAATAQTRRLDKARVATSDVVVQSREPPSKSKPGAPKRTCSRVHPAPGFSSRRSTGSTCRQQPSQARRADVATARSRLATQSSGAGSTPQPRDAHQTRGASASAVVASSSNGIKPRQVPAAVKQDVVAAASTTTQRLRQSLTPAISAARNVRRENWSSDIGSPRYGAGQKINDDVKTRSHRTAAAAAMGSGLARTGSRKSANGTIVKRTANENEDRRRQDARHGGAGAPDHRNPALLQETRRRSVASRTRLGLMAATSKGGSIASDGHRPTSGICEHVAPAVAAGKVVAGPDAFPSTRYDAMLLREDPKNLTWLRGCDEGDDVSVAGLDLVDSSLELFDVATGLSRTAVRI